MDSPLLWRTLRTRIVRRNFLQEVARLSLHLRHSRALLLDIDLMEFGDMFVSPWAPTPIPALFDLLVPHSVRWRRLVLGTLSEAELLARLIRAGKRFPALECLELHGAFSLNTSDLRYSRFFQSFPALKHLFINGWPRSEVADQLKIRWNQLQSCRLGHVHMLDLIRILPLLAPGCHLALDQVEVREGQVYDLPEDIYSTISTLTFNSCDISLVDRLLWRLKTPFLEKLSLRSTERPFVMPTNTDWEPYYDEPIISVDEWFDGQAAEEQEIKYWTRCVTMGWISSTNASSTSGSSLRGVQRRRPARCQWQGIVKGRMMDFGILQEGRKEGRLNTAQ
ncbi:hypothetical protein C8F01DRAFT_1121133 [Mycena amicta]|nr:hypothetical protein C8F01DRAFT_1121133 [Mycena amicta]